MAHLPPKLLSGLDPFSQPKTLFLPAPGKEGILVIRTGSKYQSRRKRFRSPHAALTWCLANSAGLVFGPVPDPSRN